MQSTMKKLALLKVGLQRRKQSDFSPKLCISKVRTPRGCVSQGLAVSKVPKICIKKYVPEATKAARQMVKKNIGALNILQLSSSDEKDRLNCFDKTHQY